MAPLHNHVAIANKVKSIMPPGVTGVNNSVIWWRVVLSAVFVDGGRWVFGPVARLAHAHVAAALCSVAALVADARSS